MRQLRWRAGLAGAAASVVAFAACGSSLASTGAVKKGTGTPIKIGWVNPGVGTGSVFPHATAAAKAAASYINSSLGGVDGHPIQIISCDSDGTPSSDANCAQNVLAKKPLVLSMDQDFNMAGIYQALKPTGIPLIGGVPTGPEDNTAPNTVWLSGGAPGALRNWGLWINQFVKPKSVAVLYDNPAAAAGISLLTGDIKKSGAKIVSRIINPSSPDYLAAYSAVTAAKPSVIVGLFGAESTCIGMAQAAASQHSSTPWYVTDTCSSPAVAKAAHLAIKGWHMLDINFERPTTSPSANWKIYQAAIKKYANGQTDAKSPGSFGTIMTIYSVLKKLGPKATGKAVYSYFRTKPGPVFMGGHYNCSKATKATPNLCVSQYQTFEMNDPGGPLTYAPHGHLYSYDSGTLVGGS